jgi:hypothetical protein
MFCIGYQGRRYSIDVDQCVFLPPDVDLSVLPGFIHAYYVRLTSRGRDRGVGECLYRPHYAPQYLQFHRVPWRAAIPTTHVFLWQCHPPNQWSVDSSPDPQLRAQLSHIRPARASRRLENPTPWVVEWVVPNSSVAIWVADDDPTLVHILLGAATEPVAEQVLQWIAQCRSLLPHLSYEIVLGPDYHWEDPMDWAPLERYLKRPTWAHLCPAICYWPKYQESWKQVVACSYLRDQVERWKRTCARYQPIVQACAARLPDVLCTHILSYLSPYVDL